eukprot:TRINITY_DN382_c0_g1_i8.p1 TRINITY_DN382_c0_g1~~TRINITY_DN382_c0_g1_i8.p1  ORF type:complete len:625 (+),score=169.93 TRINITY_DN382_c0_g1_i8:88-1962(+)
MARSFLVLGFVFSATAGRLSQQNDLNEEELALADLEEEKPLEGDSLQTLISALDATTESLSHDLKAVVEPFRNQQPETGMLRQLIAALTKARQDKTGDLEALNKQLLSMAAGNSNSAELREFAGQYKNIFDEQFIGERIPPALGLSTPEILAKQNKVFHMTAREMGAAMLQDWRKVSKDAATYDEAFDRKLEETAAMLVYPQAQEKLSITGHLWAHLTNMYMLVVRSLKELIDKTTLSWNLGDVTIVGGNLCNAAAREARETFMSGASQKGAAIFEFGIRWLLGKHMEVVHDLTMSMPRHDAYSKDQNFVKELKKAEKSFIDEWAENFRDDFYSHLRMSTMNVQQARIMGALHDMEGMTTKSALRYELTDCSNIIGASKRDRESFPACKCSNINHRVFCGTEEVAGRKFDALQTKNLPACTYSLPYCAAEASQHDLNGLATILNPNPAKKFYLPKKINGSPVLVKEGSFWRATGSKKTAGTVGLGFRQSMDINDFVDEKVKSMVRWGAKVEGVDGEYDEWIAVNGCDTLYKDLVDSAVDLLTLHIGSKMYDMLYEPKHAIRKNPEFARNVFEKMKGEKNDAFLGTAFPSLGQRKAVETEISRQEAEITEMAASLEQFKLALEKA